MTEFKVGDKVRVNEGPLEGQLGYVMKRDVEEGLIYVELEGPTYTKEIAFYPDVLVNANEDHDALAALKLYPDKVNSKYLWRLTTFVDGIMYQSLPIDSDMIKGLLSKPPAGLYAVEYMEKSKATMGSTYWKTLWQEP